MYRASINNEGGFIPLGVSGIWLSILAVFLPVFQVVECIEHQSTTRVASFPSELVAIVISSALGESTSMSLSPQTVGRGWGWTLGGFQVSEGELFFTLVVLEQCNNL